MIVGTVSDAGGGLPALVPVGEAVDAGAATPEETAAAEDDIDSLAEEGRETVEEIVELLASDGPAGAEDERLVRRRAQRHVER